MEPSLQTESYPSGPQAFPATGVNSLATVTRRWVARLIDSLLVGGPVLVVTSLVLVIRSTGEGSADAADAASPTVQAVTWGVLVGVAVVYETVMITLWGQTVGKFLVGIRVARLVNGRCPLWWEAALRITLPGVVATIPHPLAKVTAMGLFMVAMFDPLRRGVPDRAAGTVVVLSR